MTTDAVTPLRQRMVEDMNARKLGAHSQRSRIYNCKRFAAFLKRAPDTATPMTFVVSNCTWPRRA
jgi:integrase/recombinase XerD